VSASVAPLNPAGPRWLARASCAAVVASVVLFVAAAGGDGLWLLLLVVAQVVLVVVGLWVAIAHHGALRLGGLVLAVAALVVAFVAEVRQDLLWVVVVTGVLLIVAVAAGQLALRPPIAATVPDEVVATPPRQPFLIMNPRSGGGKVGTFDLRSRAERLGAEVALLDGPGTVDVAELARTAVANGADLLGVAGGDGTQALVAGVAAANGVPLLVIPAGTRNHFALDLGLDRDDPARSLQALTDGVDVAVDLGDVAGRPFVNNVSFGAYATIVARPDYRDDKTRVTLDALPDMLSGHQGPQLTLRAGYAVTTGPQAALVSNNPYGTGDVAGLGRRARIDTGRLGLVVLTVTNALQAARLLGGRRAPGLKVLTADEVVVESESGEVATGIDGESVVLPSPVRCTIRPRALTVRVPRDRPGVPAAHPPVSLRRMWALAGPTGRSRRDAVA
jgi:diacylglycerol kinase family enzyme